MVAGIRAAPRRRIFEGSRSSTGSLPLEHLPDWQIELRERIRSDFRTHARHCLARLPSKTSSKSYDKGPSQLSVAWSNVRQISEGCSPYLPQRAQDELLSLW